jgi:TRAP-type C4-dicarboxylate transport system substrate-binding protein
VARDEAAKALDELKKRGMTVHELPADEIAKMRERAQPVIAKFTQEIGEPLVAEVTAEVQKVRGTK